MRADVSRAINEVTVAFRQVVRRQVAYEALSIAWEAFRKGDLLSESHLEYLIGFIVHERRLSHDQLVHEDAQCVPVCGASVANIENDFGSDVLWRATESIGAIPWSQTLDEA